MNRFIQALIILHQAVFVLVASAAGEDRGVDFQREIRPILAKSCFACHGPDEKQRQAELRLDTRAGALAQSEAGGRVVVPGDLGSSRLYRKITASDPGDRMPPEEFGEPLTAAEIEVLGRWIDEGAKWDNHWAYEALTSISLPTVNNRRWARNPIDLFVLSRLEAQGLSPSRREDPARLLRRAALALTGLPPTIEELDAFLADPTSDAFEKAIDQLIGSPHYGERMAVDWLDLARYADTHGYHIDSHRDMWRWRDWVIAAHNRNMPFDQFTIEQLAGDLLPDATHEQQIATGFNRNNMINFEGGAIAEEYLTEYIVDRVVTTSTVWLGQTMECCRCHDHKYDPLSQRDFYRMYAFFNGVPENGLDGRSGNAAPMLASPTHVQQARRRRVTEQTAAIERKLARRAAAAAAEQVKWESRLTSGAEKLPQPPSDAVVYFPFDEPGGETAVDAVSGRKATVHSGGGPASGKFGDSLLFLGDTHVSIDQAAAFQRGDRFSLSVWVFPTSSDIDGMSVIERRRTDDTGRGYALLLSRGRPEFRLVHRIDDNAVKIVAKEPLPVSKWRHLAVTCDGSGKAGGVRIYVDGQLQQVEVAQDSLTQSTEVDEPLSVGGRQEGARFRGMIDEVRIYGRDLSETEVSLLAGANPIADIVRIAADQRTPRQSAALREYFLDNHDAEYQQIRAELNDINGRLGALDREIATTMVMQELQTPRDTFILPRGDYRQRGDKVSPGTPSIFPAMPTDAPNNRLGLARWIVDRDNPLTARVVVNRYWQRYFGTGIVETSEDFGVRGAAPSHPELLDWLAIEFMRSGWDVKHMQRLIVTSAAYQQSSRGTPELLERDPHNRLLARGPRMRLPAETIRDQGLLLAGLLHRQIGGVSVYPYQPGGLWKEVSFNPRDFSAQVYVQGRGADLYRRSLYTFWKRAAPPPSLAIFGAPNREVCVSRRGRTNTPLQALVLLNDPTFVEASRGFAGRIMAHGQSDEVRLAYAFRLATARSPRDREIAILRRIFEENLRDYQNDPEAAARLLQVGESLPDETLDVAELAAWTTVASVILNLDETISN